MLGALQQEGPGTITGEGRVQTDGREGVREQRPGHRDHPAIGGELAELRAGGPGLSEHRPILPPPSIATIRRVPSGLVGPLVGVEELERIAALGWRGDRVEALGGRLTVSGAQGAGTTVVATVPAR